MDKRKSSSSSDRKSGSYKSFREGDKPYKKNSEKGDDRKRFGSKTGSDRPKRDGDDKDRGRGGEKPAFKKSYGDKKEFGEKRSFGTDRPKRDGDDRPRSSKPYEDRRKPEGKGGFEKKEFGDKKPYGDKRSFDKTDRPKRDGDDRPRSSKPYEDRRKPEGKGGFEKKEFGDKKPYGDKRSFDKTDKPKRDGDDRPRSSKPYEDRKKPEGKGGFEKKEFGDKKPYGDKRSFDKTDRPKRDGDDRDRAATKAPKKPYGDKREKGIGTGEKKTHKRPFERVYKPRKEYIVPERVEKAVAKPRKRTKKERDEDVTIEMGLEAAMPLNKYIAHSGECSRRDAAEMVRLGKVKVNNELVVDPGYKVNKNDSVTIAGKKLSPQVELVYILLNKPKDFITTTEDPQGRKTVMDLVASAEIERLYPVGRLDRNTTGLILMTNDGDLAQKLSHPAHEIKKVYQVTLDSPLTKSDFDKLLSGVDLEDGIAHVDAISYLDTKDEIGLEIHSGRNRIVRRLFEALGYEVVKLDRMMYAGLTKKNLPRGKWRFLDEREVVLLKHFKR